MVEPQPSKLMMRVRFPLPAQWNKYQVMNKIRNLFKVETNFQLLKVNVVFAATGTASVYFAGIVINFLGLEPIYPWRFLLLGLKNNAVSASLSAFTDSDWKYIWRI